MIVDDHNGKFPGIVLQYKSSHRPTNRFCLIASGYYSHDTRPRDTVRQFNTASLNRRAVRIKRADAPKPAAPKKQMQPYR
ncbi:MAG TPA: hypothetical protein VGF90_03770 [Verrucomicrobiae bacterium]